MMKQSERRESEKRRCASVAHNGIGSFGCPMMISCNLPLRAPRRKQVKYFLVFREILARCD